MFVNVYILALHKSCVRHNSLPKAIGIASLFIIATTILQAERNNIKMKDFFKELFEYGYHLNQNLSETFTENKNKVSEKSILLFSHILDAHHVWNSRIESKLPAYGIWELQSIDSFKIIDRQNFESSLRILEKFDLSDIISYTTSNGQPYSNNVRDLLFHSINHSTYHRAQIATEFKVCGIEPLISDYIFYKWRNQ